MTESTDTMTNCSQSGGSSSDNIVNLDVAPTQQQEYVHDENGLFDGDRHHLTLYDLQPVPISDHNLNVFDELSHQCNALLYSSNSQQKLILTTKGINNFLSSDIMPTTTTIEDYERRFQRSLQKLPIPSWYTDVTSSSKISSKQSITSILPIPSRIYNRECQRTPEIIYVHRPQSYRSCRSSIATSPSPSTHSWHPNHMTNGMNFSLLVPSSRRHNKYKKGIERVSKSSHWYQPAQFSTNEIGTVKISTPSKHKQNSALNNHYDTPKIHYNNEKNKSSISKSPVEQLICLVVTNSDDENTSVNKQNNNMITNDKQQDNHIISDESQAMPLASTKESFTHIELEEITDEDDDNRSLSIIDKKYIPELSIKIIDDDDDDDDDDETNEVLEYTANELVDSILADILLMKNLNDDADDEDDTNSGVRELSEDGNGLRELDEDDMNDTDEFIVLATQAETSDDDQPSDIPRCNFNRLYTFSRANDNSIENSKQKTIDQNSPKSILENDVIATHTQSNTNSKQSFDNLYDLSPMSHSYIQKEHIDLDPYIDGIIIPSNNRFSTYYSPEGVNEETARIGRFLLDSIPIPHNETIPSQSVQPIIKTREEYQRIIEDFDEELNEEVCRDSGYSSNQERINIQQSLYEPLSECYSGYCFNQSDFVTANASSLQTTTDEAYESEPTTISSSIVTTTPATHVHPDLKHEFEYPSPPPPVPDRRLKPAHLRSPPAAKPRLIQRENIDSLGYSVVQKSKPLPIASIQQLVTPTSNDSTAVSTKTMNSRYYCGPKPASNEPISSSINSSPTKTKEHSKNKNKEKRNSKALSCLHSSATDDNDTQKTTTKSSSSLNKTKTKQLKLTTDFDEATNGLAIRLPAPMYNGHDATNKHNLNRTSTTSSIKRTNGITNNRQLPDKPKSNRSPLYETSV